jgi:hypothetical protein
MGRAVAFTHICLEWMLTTKDWTLLESDWTGVASYGGFLHLIGQ